MLRIVASWKDHGIQATAVRDAMGNITKRTELNTKLIMLLHFNLQTEDKKLLFHQLSFV